jgi:hypothetical protein
MTSTSIRCAIAIAAGFAALSWNGEIGSGPALSTANAVIGRPLTPLSYAGVARRTTRRAVYAGAVASTVVVVAAPPVVVVPAPTCVQVVNSYGHVYTRC